MLFADATVLAAGDVAYCVKQPALASAAAGTAALLAREPGAPILMLGDGVYQHGTAREYAQCYGPTWGRFKDRTWPVAGNRDYLTKGAAGYFAYFGKPPYYSFTVGGWRLYALDSNLSAAAMEGQLAWLERDLADHPAPCTLAYWHHPLYSSGGHGSEPVMQKAWEILYRAGAELVLSGHDHDYERFAPQDAAGHADPKGIAQFVVGTGGAFATPILWPKANSEARDANRTGVLKLRLMEDGYAWEFLEASYDGFAEVRRTDRGEAKCH